MEGPSSTPPDIVAGINALRAERGLGSVSSAVGSERPLWETLSRLPREITSYQILGKSVGDLAKEVVVSGAAGALFRIGLGSAGVGGIGLAAAVGGGVMGIKEHYKHTNETWQRMRAEQGVARLGAGDTLKGFFNPDEKRKITLAIGRGAMFGAAGGVVGGFISETGVGEAVKGAFDQAGQFKDKMLEKAGAVTTSGYTVTVTPVESGAQAAPTAPTETPTSVPPTSTVEPSDTPTTVPSPSPTGTPVPPASTDIAPLRDKPIIGPVADVIGGGFHNLGLRVQEVGEFIAEHRPGAPGEGQEVGGIETPAPAPSPTAVPAATPEPSPVAPPVEPEVPPAPAEALTAQPLPADISERLAQMPQEISLERGSSPWQTSEQYLKEILGRNPTNSEIVAVTKELAKASAISVPKWNISGEGFTDHRKLPVSFKLIFNDDVKSVIERIAQYG